MQVYLKWSWIKYVLLGNFRRGFCQKFFFKCVLELIYEFLTNCILMIDAVAGWWLFILDCSIVGFHEDVLDLCSSHHEGNKINFAACTSAPHPDHFYKMAISSVNVKQRLSLPDDSLLDAFPVPTPPIICHTAWQVTKATSTRLRSLLQFNCSSHRPPKISALDQNKTKQKKTTTDVTLR